MSIPSVQMAYRLGGLEGISYLCGSTNGGLTTCDGCDNFKTPAKKQTL